MSPGDLQRLTDAISAIGTLGLCILAVVALYRRWVVPRAEVNDTVAEWEDRWAKREAGYKTDWTEREAGYKGNLTQMIDYVEERRVEERNGRLEAERRLAEMVESIDSLTSLLQTVKDEVIRNATHRG
jgi:hypothetical protein